MYTDVDHYNLLLVWANVIVILFGSFISMSFPIFLNLLSFVAFLYFRDAFIIFNILSFQNLLIHFNMNPIFLLYSRLSPLKILLHLLLSLVFVHVFNLIFFFLSLRILFLLCIYYLFNIGNHFCFYQNSWLNSTP